MQPPTAGPVQVGEPRERRTLAWNATGDLLNLPSRPLPESLLSLGRFPLCPCWPNGAGFGRFCRGGRSEPVRNHTMDTCRTIRSRDSDFFPALGSLDDAPVHSSAAAARGPRYFLLPAFSNHSRLASGGAPDHESGARGKPRTFVGRAPGRSGAAAPGATRRLDRYVHWNLINVNREVRNATSCGSQLKNQAIESPHGKETYPRRHHHASTAATQMANTHKAAAVALPSFASVGVNPAGGPLCAPHCGQRHVGSVLIRTPARSYRPRRRRPRPWPHQPP